MRITIVALIIIGSLLCASLLYNARYTELLDILIEQNAILEDQVSLYREQVSQLEGERDFYREEVQYWQGEAAFEVVDWQGNELRKFSSVEDLRWWLGSNPISENRAIPSKYDCDDFAIDLILSALADGYWIGLGVTEWYMFNFTIIGNDIYKIEAMTDGVEHWGMLD